MQDNRFDTSVAQAVTRLFREQNRAFGRAVEPFGISAEQAQLLPLLWTHGPLSMTELGREAGLSSGTLSAAVDRMEAAGLVRRVADPADGRGVRVAGVAWSAAKRDGLFAALEATEDSVFGALSTAERRTLHALLSRVLDGAAPASKRATRGAADAPKKKSAKR